MRYKVAYFSCFFPLMRLRGKMSTRSSSHTEINWTRLWVAITHVTLDFGKGIHTLSARRRLIMEKVVKAPALPLGIRVWYPPGKQQAVGNLRPPLPLRRKPAWRANCRPNTDIPSHYSQAHRHDWQTCAKLLNSGTFFFFLFIIVLIQSTTSKAEREIGLEKVTWRRNFCRWTRSTSGG